ncbi:hypothetical protein HTV45_08345 [Streptomyces sp. CHD11]|uniref:hypothetical protein n=1 Tax=Streptomyces sp. CHD11 TaxID=2741325 RepID=UPI001BFC26FD|nr:hypothetical protein [Streptomyces sp. CHD11]MBT3150896.1 hypothetical protein [Streptomyces sp. CHD11]
MSTATTWALVVETTRGIGQRKHTVAEVLVHVLGSREAALAELERLARDYFPEHPAGRRRRRLLRTADGFLLVVDGSWQTFASRFTVGELLTDSDAPPAPEPVAAGPAPAPPAPPATPAAPVFDPDEKDEDGIPVRPAWLNRPGLS